MFMASKAFQFNIKTLNAIFICLTHKMMDGICEKKRDLFFARIFILSEIWIFYFI